MESTSDFYGLYNGYLSSPVIYLVFGFVFLMVVYWNGMRRYSVLKKLNIPGPKPLPYIGNILEIRKHGGIVNYQLECMKKYGKIFAIWTPNLSIVVADPEMLKQIMVKEFENFTNRVTHVQTSQTGLGVASARDENWKRIRHTLTPTFSAAKMKLMVPLMEKASDTLVSKMEGVADSGKSVEIRKWFSQMALDVILMTSFATESDVQTNPNSDFFKQSSNLIVTHGPIQLLLKLIPCSKILSLLLEKLYFFWYPKNPWSILIALAETAIRTRQEELKKGVTGRKDLLQLMLTAHESDGVKKLSDEEISAQSLGFLFAGHHTTSLSLTNIVYHLSTNSDVQERLRREIESALQRHAGMSFYDLVNNIEYLDCVFNEAQRLAPLSQISFVNRECAKSCDINGVHFPAGTEIVIKPYLLHHDSDAWPSVNEFDPERHRGPAMESRHPNQFMPFGAGPRHCIGMRFALLEVKLTLVKLMRKFRFVLDPNIPITSSSRAHQLHVLIESVK